MGGETRKILADHENIMELKVRHLSEGRIRELLAGMPDFDRRIRRLGRTKRGRTPVPIPAASEYPSAASLADIVAPYYSDKAEEVDFYRDMMRLQELWGYAHAIPRCARAGIEADIANLRAQTEQILANAATPELAAMMEKLVAARIAYLESITAEELAAIEQCAPEIEAAFRRRMEARTEERRRRSTRRRRARTGDS